jgi:hypothetical protein
LSVSKPPGDSHAITPITCAGDPRITSETYLHLDPSYLRREIDKLSFGSPSEETDTTAAAPAAPLVSIVRLDPETGRGEGDLLALESMVPGALTAERDKGFEPSTFSLGS